MTPIAKKFVIGAMLLTVASLILWQATGGDFYTKYQIVEVVPMQLDPDDPLVAAGFYDDDATETITRDEFRFGLLPTAEGLFDKHVISVLSFTAPTWFVTLGIIWWSRRKLKAQIN